MRSGAPQRETHTACGTVIPVGTAALSTHATATAVKSLAGVPHSADRATASAKRYSACATRICDGLRGMTGAADDSGYGTQIQATTAVPGSIVPLMAAHDFVAAGGEQTYVTTVVAALDGGEARGATAA